MLFAKIAAPSLVYETALEARIAIGEVAGAGYECSPRTRAVLCWALPHSQRLGATPSMVPAPGLLPTWFLVRSTSTHTRYTASYNHAWRRFEVRDGVETGLIPSGLQPASVKAKAVRADGCCGASSLQFHLLAQVNSGMPWSLINQRSISMLASCRALVVSTTPTQTPGY
jgi:hypothetical protein